MNQPVSKISFVALMLSGVMFAQSQSGDALGDIARANRSKQDAQQTAGTSPKVITNQDLPVDPSEGSDESPSQPKTKLTNVKKPDRNADQRLSNRLIAEQRLDEQWKARIQDQEDRIADLQARIERLNTSIRTAVGTAQYETPASRTHAIQMERLANMQETLDQQKRKLEQMQDAARRAGAGQ